MLEVLLFSFLAIIVGIGLTLLGYAAFRVLLPIVGFLAGLWVGMDMAANLLGNAPILGLSLGLVLGLVLGVIFAAIAYLVYSVAIILIGLALGYALGAGVMMFLGMDGLLAWLIGVIAAIAVGALFIRGNMPKVYIMVITAFAGASALIAGVMVLFGQISPDQLGLSVLDPYIAESWFWLIVWAVIGALGFVIQYQSVEMAESYIPAAYNYDATVKEYKTKSRKS